MLPAACTLCRKLGFSFRPPAPQALEALQLNMAPGPLAALVPALRGFPRLKRVTLDGRFDEGFALAELRHLPALESLEVSCFDTVSLLSETLPRLTSLAVIYGNRLEMGAGAALPSLRSLVTEDVETVVLRGSLPQLTLLGIREINPLLVVSHVSVSMLAGSCLLPDSMLLRSAWAGEAATFE